MKQCYGIVTDLEPLMTLTILFLLEVNSTKFIREKSGHLTRRCCYLLILILILIVFFLRGTLLVMNTNLWAGMLSSNPKSITVCTCDSGSLVGTPRQGNQICERC